MRLADMQLAFPGILLAIAILAVLGPGAANVILVLGIGGWTGYARIVRGQVLSHRERDYVVPRARSACRRGGSSSATCCRTASARDRAGDLRGRPGDHGRGGALLPRPRRRGRPADLGQHARRRAAYLGNAWWLATFPGIAISLVVLSINLLGDWIRDVLDPRLRNLL